MFAAVPSSARCRAAVGIGFQSPYPSHTHRKTCGNPHGNPYPQNPEILQSVLVPHTLRIFVRWIFYSVTMCIMIMQEKLKNVIKTNSKFDSIWRNSNIDYDIYRIFNAFPTFRLISHPFKNPHRIPTGLWGFITVHIHGNPHGNLHTHGSPGQMTMAFVTLLFSLCIECLK